MISNDNRDNHNHIGTKPKNNLSDILLVANWKMNKTIKESAIFFKEFNEIYSPSLHTSVVICPPSYLLLNVLKQLSPIQAHLGAQNMHYELTGAFTGEISPQMLCDAGVSYIILGHSERRTIFNEKEVNIAKKVSVALKLNMIPIICIGESLDQRKNGLTAVTLKSQLYGSLSQVRHNPNINNLVIAYEPIWAIGTGVNASPTQTQETHSFIRDTLSEMYNHNVANDFKLLYGGSVKPENTLDLIKQPDVDGFLIGGASLNPLTFWKIIKIVQEEVN